MKDAKHFLLALGLLVILGAVILLGGRVKTVPGAENNESTAGPALQETEPTDTTENSGSPDDLQLYAQQVAQAQTPNTLTLAVMADTHYCAQEGSGAEKLAIARKMAKLSGMIQVDAIANLGDFVRGDEVRSETESDLTKLLEATHTDAKCPVFYVRGNHDDNGWYSLEQDGNPGDYLPSEMLNHREWMDIAFNTTAKDVVTDSKNPNGGYGYYDHEASKIRIFLLNCVDIPYILNDDGSYRYNSYQCYAFSNHQLNFVADALQFSDKENPGEWAALFLTHVPMDTTIQAGKRIGSTDALIRGHMQLLGIIGAYRKGISYQFSGSVNNASIPNERAEDFLLDISVDYSQKGVGDVIAFVNGHTHTDNASQKVGYEHSISYGYTYLSVIGADSFATLVVDRNKSTVTTFKYGPARPQSMMLETNPGAIDGEKELKVDMQSGVWTVPFDQFRPNGENLFSGVSSQWQGGYFPTEKSSLNTETLEVISAQANDGWILSKAIPVKQATQYAVSGIGQSVIYYYRAGGAFSGALKTSEWNGQQIITAKDGEAGGYIVICFYKLTPEEIEKVQVQELVWTE